MKTALRSRGDAILTLTLTFISYKALLLTLALLSHNLAIYDTSSLLALENPILTNWDAVYFQSIAITGYKYEQEFAFGPFLPFLLKAIHPLVLGNLTSYASVILFYKLSLAHEASDRAAKTAALLLIFSPAGIFLCIGYTEPLFSFLMFLGLYLQSKSSLMAAIVWGLSGLTRATGVLNALFFLPKLRRTTPSKVIEAMVYGGITALPWLLWQAYAYKHFCLTSSTVSISDLVSASIDSRTMSQDMFLGVFGFRLLNQAEGIRPWCSRELPLIYSFVQDRYWNVGFLRYFTLGNVPLFMISAPMYVICYMSLSWTSHGIIQGLLTTLTLTSAHAQIITRMSSGFPQIYWFLARKLIQDDRTLEREKHHLKSQDYVSVTASTTSSLKPKHAFRKRMRRWSETPETFIDDLTGRRKWRAVVGFWICYGMIQAVLFGAFLPPA